MSLVVINREVALKNLETLASEENIKDLQPGADGSTLELKSSWGHREVSLQQNESETQEKVQNIISDTLKFAEHFQNKDVVLTESEACSLSRIMNALHESLPLCTGATDEQRARKNLLLSIFHKSAMAGLGSESALSPVLRTSLCVCDSLLLNQNLSKDIAPIAAKVAEAGLKTSKKMPSLYLLKGLVDQGLNFETASQAAIEGMKDPVLQEASLGILTALVRKEQSFDIAITAAQQGLSKENPWVRLVSLGLILELLEKGQGIKEAHVATLQAAQDKDVQVRWNSLVLFKALFTLNQGFDSITLKALEGLHSKGFSSDPESEPLVLEIYKILAEKGHAYETAIKLAIDAQRRCADFFWWQANQHLRYVLVVRSLNLLEALVDKGHAPAYDLAIKAAKKYLKSITHPHETAAANLVKALYKQGKLDEGSDEVLKAAQATKIKTLEF